MGSLIVFQKSFTKGNMQPPVAVLQASDAQVPDTFTVGAKPRAIRGGHPAKSPCTPTAGAAPAEALRIRGRCGRVGKVVVCLNVPETAAIYEKLAEADDAKPSTD